MNMKKKNEISAAGWDEKTLYICLQLEEYGAGASSRSWLIQAVDLSHLLLPSANSSCTPINSDTNTKLVRTVACFPDFDLKYQGPCCGVFGSKILFAGKSDLNSSREVYVFETDPNVDPEPMIEKSCSPSFVNGKRRTLLMELDDGNLYALSRSHRGPDQPHPAFEFFDSCKGKWSALPDPPLFVEHAYGRHSPRWSDICCATVGNNILLSSPSDPRTLHCFDAAARLWTQHSTVDPLVSSPAGRALVLNCDDDDDDDGFIVFTYSDNHLWDDSSYSRKNRWDSIQVYHMTKEYEHLRQIESHQMPHHEHFPVRLGRDHNDYDDKYSFVHLGGRQFCLVLGCRNWYRGEGIRLTMVVVMFEYAMAKREEASLGQFNFLATRLLEFDINRYRERIFNINEGALLGAFVMPPPETKKRKAATAAHKNSNLSPAAKPFFPSFNSNSVTYHYTTATRMDGSQFPQLPSVARMVAPTSTLGHAHHYQYPYLHPNSHSQDDYGHMTRWEPTPGFGIHGSNNGGYEFTQQPTVGHMVAPLMRTDWYTDQYRYQYPFQTGLISLDYAPLQPGPGYPNSQTEAYLGHYSHNWLYPTFYQRHN